MMMYVFFKFNLDISLLFRLTVCEVMNWKRLAWCFIFFWNLTLTFFGMHKYADGKMHAFIQIDRVFYISLCSVIAQFYFAWKKLFGMVGLLETELENV